MHDTCRRCTRIASALIVSLTLFAPQAHAGKPKMGKQVVIADRGIALQILDDFNPIPLMPSEKFIIRKWKGPDFLASDWMQFNATLDLVWIPKLPEREAKPAPAADDIEGQIKARQQEFIDEMKVKDVWDWAQKNFHGITQTGKEQTIKLLTKITPPGEKRAKKGKTEGRYSSISIPTWSEGPGYMGVMMIVPTDKGEWGIFYSHHSSEFVDYYPVFLKSLQTFMQIDPAEGGVVEVSGGFNEYDGEAFRKARKATLTEGWKTYDTPNYLIIHHVDDRFAKEIAGRLEGCRRLYEVYFPPKLDKKAVSVVRVCKDRDEYMLYGAPGGSAGYWSPHDKELVFYKDTQGGKGDTFAVLHHEAFHQYIYYLYGEISPHSWYNEGYGDYFAGFKFDDKHNVRKEKPFHWRTETVRGYFKSGELVPLAQFIRYTQREYYTRPDLCYSQGWAFIYFLRQSADLKPAWKAILDVYLKTIWEETQRRDMEKAAKEAEKEGAGEAEGEADDSKPAGEGEVGGEGSDSGSGESEDEGDEFEGFDFEGWLSQFNEDEEVLRIAVDAAFSGIDINELERAFHEFIDSNFK